jgi:GTP cyclohydrolase II
MAFSAPGDPNEHLAFVHGEPAADGMLVRLHSECMTGDLVGSLRCDCGEQLDLAMKAIVEHGSGALVYLRGHEGRGIGIAAKLRAYALQEQGLDTIAANVALGLPVDARDFRAPAEFLMLLGLRSVRLLTNNFDKAAALEAAGVGVAEIRAMPSTVTPHNRRYLATKVQSMGHRGLLAEAFQ